MFADNMLASDPVDTILLLELKYFRLFLSLFTISDKHQSGKVNQPSSDLSTEFL